MNQQSVDTGDFGEIDSQDAIVLGVDSERIRCPRCKRDVTIPAKGGSGAAMPTKSEA